jgi:hypothetical protein
MLSHLPERTRGFIKGVALAAVAAFAEAYLDIAEGVLKFLGIM